MGSSISSNMYKLLFSTFFLLLLAFNSDAQRSRMGKDSECYTANGRDYEGTQSMTYVKGAGAYEPTLPNIEECLMWKDQDLDFNVTDRAKTLPLNYCRNPNRRLFPWCYVLRNGGITKAYCHIPTCSTPALIGCFKLYVNDDGPPKHLRNVTTTGKPPDVILNGEESLVYDEQMKIARCLNFCRSKKKYDYAGVTGGDSCMCGKEKEDGKRMNDVLNQLHPHDCLSDPCNGDQMQACGGDNAIAIYDVEAGACDPPPFQDRDLGVIYSPRWPGTYHHEATCGWTIYVPDKFLTDTETRKKYLMHIYFSYFYLEKDNDTLKIYTYANSTDTNSIMVAKYSGGETPATIVLEVEKVFAVHIVFNSDKDEKYNGFILNYNITTRDGQLETTLPDVVITDTTTPRTTKRITPRPTTKPTTRAPITHRSSTAPATKTTTTKSPSSVTTSGPTASSTTTASSASTTTQNNTQIGAKQSSASLNGGQIAGIVLGVVLFIVLIVLAIFIVLRFMKNGTVKENGTPRPPEMFNNPVSFNTEPNL